MKTKVLILASNLQRTTSLGLNQEIRNLSEIIKSSSVCFEIETRLAVRPQDLQTALLEVKPRIVHFCGHGEGELGLVLENNWGQLYLASTNTLADLFRHFSQQIECVLLNACYTQVQAEAIAKHINFVVGMPQPILDRSAIAFSAGFYSALGAGNPIGKAYDFGRNCIHSEFGDLSSSRKLIAVKDKKDIIVPHHLIPKLFTNQSNI
ncbi:CHAT domain-containing protein [Myxosarcina sp. GI1]|uniref:CHAT domain-containing protein n=1 Tax=Myxosarcina sp. GI1 TaxID=1541065 RepID=UPI00068AAA58|nr:CHAT domain-containing protein [Myxosarcina sp. GI1]